MYTLNKVNNSKRMSMSGRYTRDKLATNGPITLRNHNYMYV